MQAKGWVVQELSARQEVGWFRSYQPDKRLGGSGATSQTRGWVVQELPARQKVGWFRSYHLDKVQIDGQPDTQTQ